MQPERERIIRRDIRQVEEFSSREKAHCGSFMLYLNENYGNSEAADCTKAIVKIENYFRR